MLLYALLLLFLFAGPLNSTIGNISHKYYTPITPADATFGIWGECFVRVCILYVTVCSYISWEVLKGRYSVGWDFLQNNCCENLRPKPAFLFFKQEEFTVSIYFLLVSKVLSWKYLFYVMVMAATNFIFFLLLKISILPVYYYSGDWLAIWLLWIENF